MAFLLLFSVSGVLFLSAFSSFSSDGRGCSTSYFTPYRTEGQESRRAFFFLHRATLPPSHTRRRPPPFSPFAKETQEVGLPFTIRALTLLRRLLPPRSVKIGLFTSLPLFSKPRPSSPLRERGVFFFMMDPYPRTVCLFRNKSPFQDLS